MEREKLSENFYRDEFECHGEDCCDHSAPVDPRLARALQDLRDLTKSPIYINRGFSCKKHNAQILGAAENSQHCLSTAADIYSRVFDPQALAMMAETIDAFNDGGIGLYEGRIHVDVRTTGKARWGF